MSIETKKPMLKETVGAQYYAFNTPDEQLKLLNQLVQLKMVKVLLFVQVVKTMHHLIHNQVWI